MDICFFKSALPRRSKRYAWELRKSTLSVKYAKISPPFCSLCFAGASWDMHLRWKQKTQVFLPRVNYFVPSAIKYLFYFLRLQNDPEVRVQVSKLHERLDGVEDAARTYKRQFSAYEYLWTTDLKGVFQEFLKWVGRCVSWYSWRSTFESVFCYQNRLFCPRIGGCVNVQNLSKIHSFASVLHVSIVSIFPNERTSNLISNYI